MDRVERGFEPGQLIKDELLQSGVRIYEYLPGILHAKTMVVDNTWATVGSANMDIRSFRLNFEVNAAISGADFATHLADIFHKDLRHAKEITFADVNNKTIVQRTAESLALLQQRIHCGAIDFSSPALV